jgi:hypothetical protein
MNFFPSVTYVTELDPYLNYFVADGRCIWEQLAIHLENVCSMRRIIMNLSKRLLAGVAAVALGLAVSMAGVRAGAATTATRGR